MKKRKFLIYKSSDLIWKWFVLYERFFDSKIKLYEFNYLLF